MRLNTRKLAIFSVTINVLLIFASVFFVLKRWHFQYQLEHPLVFKSYRDNPQYAEQIKIETAYERPVKIIMLGNSHVYKAHWDELLNRGDIGNRGIGSDITEGYLHRLKYILDCHPAICFIEGGINDLCYYIPADTAIKHLSSLIDTLKYHHILPVLHTVMYVGQSYQDSQKLNGRIGYFNAEIIALAKNKGIDIINLNASLCENGFLKPEFQQADALHLTGSAYIVWKDAIEKILQKYNI